MSAAQQLSLPEQMRLASELMQAAAQKLQASSVSESSQPEQVKDPLIGLFDGSPDLATRSEEILAQAVQSASVFT
ncbi:MAG: hypothetical protein ACFCU8_01745 [Thermosynechococcaceae cyanobacterium]